MAGIVSVLMSLQSYSAVNNDADMKALEATIARMTHQAKVVESSAQIIKEATNNGAAGVATDTAKG